MKAVIGFKGTVREFQAHVRPEINRCAMMGLKLTKDQHLIQSRIDKAVARSGRAA